MAKEQKDFFIEGKKMPLMITDYDWHGAEMHWHNYWELLIQCEGRTMITVGREQFVSTPGNATFIEPNQLHETLCMTEKHQMLLLQFESSLLLPFVDFNGGHKYMPLLMNGGYKVVNRIAEADTPKLLASARGLLEVEQQKEEGYEFEMYSQLLHILSTLISHNYLLIPQMEDESQKALLSIRPVLVFLEQNYHEKIIQQDMAKMCFMSSAYFSRQFKKATGLNMVDYINRIRLKEAVRLLITSTTSISEISSLTGFATVNYFNRVFKEAYKMSPREYRNKIG